jgi:hypothetical protein
MTLPSGPLMDQAGLVTRSWARAFESEPVFTGIVPRRVPLVGADGLLARVWQDYFRTKGIPPRNADLADERGYITPPWAAFLSED